MRLAFAVVGHVDRLRHGSLLASIVGAELYLDDGELGVYGNHRRALLSAHADASHVIVLEDDALLCPDFAHQVERIVTLRPDHLIGLYVGRQRPVGIQSQIPRAIDAAERTKSDFLPLYTTTMRWGVAYVMPAEHVTHAIARADALPQLAADRRIGAWHGEHHRLSYAWPSLVDHADGPSLSREHGERAPGRVAWKVRGGG